MPYNPLKTSGLFLARRPSRAVLPLCVALLALSACKEEKHHNQPELMVASPAPPPSPAGGAGSAATQQASLAYSHSMTVRVPLGSFDKHYADLRDACLHDQTLHCLLLSALIEHEGADDQSPIAHVEVRLPHDQVSAFIARALHPLAGDKPGDVQAISQSTRAEDLSQPVADATTRNAELENYRNRLTELSKRPDTKAADLIQIERELAHTQAEIDNTATSLRDMNTRIDTESLFIAFQSIVPEKQTKPASPIRDALAQSGSLFIGSLADVIRFVFGALPWVPVVLGAAAILRFAGRRWKRVPFRWPWDRTPRA